MKIKNFLNSVKTGNRSFKDLRTGKLSETMQFTGILDRVKSRNLTDKVKGLHTGKLSKNKRVWGLEICDRELKATKVKWHDGKLLVEVFDRIDYATMNQGAESANSKLIENAISTFVKRNHIEKSDKIVVSLPAKMVLSRFVSFPPMKKSYITEAIKYELQKQIPFDPSEIVWDFHQFGNSNKSDKGPEVGIFATKKENVYNLLSGLSAIKSNIESIQINPIAIYNLMQHIFKQDEDVFVVNVGKENTDFIVVGKTKYWNRSIPIAEISTELIQEIQRSIGYYVSIAKDAKPETVFLMGEGLADDKKAKFIEENLEGKVNFLNLLDRITISEDADSSPLDKKSIDSYGVAVGLAVQGLEISKIKINLLPSEYMRERQKPKQKELARILVVLLFLGLLTQGVKNYVSWKILSKDVDIVNSTQDRVRKLERLYKEVEQKVKKEESELLTLNSLGTQGNFWIEAIHNIVNSMPENVYLLSLKSIRGNSYAEDKSKEKGSAGKKGNSNPVNKKVLIMTMKGESYEPSMQYLEKNVKEPIENLKLFENLTPAFMNVEFVKDSVHHVELLNKNGSEVSGINKDIRPIAFELRWIVNNIN
ncbi:MAG: pilus assembly protein PilM [Candidatus Scalindua sp.]|nr:pilus assembly protein PilM [Candidatus Scalindua sp.]